MVCTHCKEPIEIERESMFFRRIGIKTNLGVLSNDNSAYSTYRHAEVAQCIAALCRKYAKKYDLKTIYENPDTSIYTLLHEAERALASRGQS